MMLRLAAVLVAVCFCTSALFVARADEHEPPTIAFLKYYSSSGIRATTRAIWDMFEAYGFINPDERAALENEEDIEGERINIFFDDAGGDLPTANVMVNNALDRGADIMLTISTPVSSIAAKAAQEMLDPPLLFFSLVSTPYAGGIASSPCIKSPNVAGTHIRQPYELIVPLVQVQNPDIQIIGTFVDRASSDSVEGSRKIAEAAAELGLEVEVAPIAWSSDLPNATQALLDKGVEALVYSGAYLESLGVTAMATVAADYGVPTFGPPMLTAVDLGGTVGAGFKDFYREGVVVARMMISHLQGTVDVRSLAINSTPSIGIAVNVDAAYDAGIDISEDLLAMADYVVEDGRGDRRFDTPRLPAMSLEERQAHDAAFLAELECTPERIAEEQAVLDAADS